jgi:metal-responsive CopG/Arc/MetJ family transcriptional regulator
MNADEKQNVSLSIEADLLKLVDARIKELDLNRSQYFRRLAREEIERTRPKQPELISHAA